jgi:non-ribosomal peptide synthetase component F
LAAEKQSEVLQQINTAWEQAREQLEKLRREVERNSAMAQASLQTKFLNRDRDQALRDFGEAVWTHMKKGKLQLPPALTAAVKAMLEVEKRLEAQAAHIDDLLQEGKEAAERLRERKSVGNSVVTNKAKKR